MDYKTGDKIPSSDIIRRLKDEDGVYLELKGENDHLFRVGAGDILFFKLDKEEKLKGDLAVLEDFREKDAPPVGPIPEADELSNGEEDNIFEDNYDVDSLADPGREDDIFAGDFGSDDISPANDEPFQNNFDIDKSPKNKQVSPSSTDHDIKPSDEVTAKIDISKIVQQIRPENEEFEEGTRLPEYIRSKCKKNEYGGYSLNHGDFYYVLDPKYVIEIKKSTKSKSVISLTEDLPDASPSSAATADRTFDLGRDDFDSQVTQNGSGPLTRGDMLPDNLKSRCEELIGPSGGYRIEIDSYLYLLDKDYRVTNRMGLSVTSTDDTDVDESQTVPQAQTETKQEKNKKPEIPPEKIVDSVIKKFKIALKFDKIEADFFVEKVFDNFNKQIFLNVLQGDLSRLNEDLAKSASLGNLSRSPENGGISFLKAALIHEFYMKSTFKGRGEKVVDFVTHIISPWKDNSLTITQQDLDFLDQEKLMDYLSKRCNDYPDVCEVLRRFYIDAKSNIHGDYAKIKKPGKTLFKAFLIDYLYEKTSRLEKKDGSSFIALTRDIIDFSV